MRLSKCYVRRNSGLAQARNSGGRNTGVRNLCPKSRERKAICVSVAHLCRAHLDCDGIVPGPAWEAMWQASQVVDL